MLHALGSMDDRLTDLKVEIEQLPMKMRASVREGMLDAVRDLQEQARKGAGTWLFDGIGGMFRRIGWLVLIVVAVYMLGGPLAVLGMLKTVFAASPK